MPINNPGPTLKYVQIASPNPSTTGINIAWDTTANGIPSNAVSVAILAVNTTGSAKTISIDGSSAFSLPNTAPLYFTTDGTTINASCEAGSTITLYALGYWCPV